MAWSDAYLRLAARAVHEIRDPLNGVAVNVEVLRLRAARASDGPALLPFADAAAGELERAAERIEALLALARPVPEPVDVAGPLGQLVALYGPIAAAEGGTLALENECAGWPALTAAPAAPVRAVLAAVLELAISARSAVACTLAMVDDSPLVSVRGAQGAWAPEPALDTAAAASRIRVERDANGLTIRFPRASAAGA